MCEKLFSSSSTYVLMKQIKFVFKNLKQVHLSLVHNRALKYKKIGTRDFNVWYRKIKKKGCIFYSQIFKD